MNQVAQNEPAETSLSDPFDIYVQQLLRTIPAHRQWNILNGVLEAETFRYFANKAQRSTLDPSFKVRKDSRKFFKKGRVLRTLWTEPAGAMNEDQRETPDYGERYNLSLVKQQVDPRSIFTANYREKVYSNIKIFAVIEEAENFCIAVKIDTYRGQGCNASGVITGKHAIAYSGKHVPERLPEETGLLDMPIRVNPDDSKGLEPRSRINFGKLYTLEHNIKVVSVGQVHQSSMSVMDSHFAKFHPSWINYKLDPTIRYEQNSFDLDQDSPRMLVQPTTTVLYRSLRGWNLPVHKIICAAGALVQAECEGLLPDYAVQCNPNKFFTVGKVFTIMCWEEHDPATNGSGVTLSKVTDNIAGFSENGEPQYVQRRWFTVIKEGVDSCLCLRIQSYENQGIPDGFIKRHHCIVYTGKSVPEPLSLELATRDDITSLQDPIRIRRLKPSDPKIQLTPTHRLCYSEIYEVKHNVMARAFGEVDRRCKWSLKPQVKELLHETDVENGPTSGLLRQPNVTTISTPISRRMSSSETSDDGQSPTPGGSSRITAVFNAGINHNIQPPLFCKNDRVLLPGKVKPTARAKFKPCRIHEAQVARCGHHWEYSLKHEHHDGLFAPGQLFHEERLIRDEDSCFR